MGDCSLEKAMRKTDLLPDLFTLLHQEMEAKIKMSGVCTHTGTKGTSQENKWIDLLQKYLPERYSATRCMVVDSYGEYSNQIDIVVHDRQYSPFILHDGENTYVPVESVYAVFDTKSGVGKSEIEDTLGKIRSVRKLTPTSVPIPHAGGVFKKKTPHHIMGGVLGAKLSCRMDLSEALVKWIGEFNQLDGLDLGCVLESGGFEVQFSEDSGRFCDATTSRQETGLVFFLLAFIRRLQAIGTVPALDISAYERWIRAE
jgi:hypothetical protein